VSPAADVLLDLALSQGSLERPNADRRDGDIVRHVLAASSTRVLDLVGRRARTCRVDGRLRLVLRSPTFDDRDKDVLYLGRDRKGAAYVAVVSAAQDPADPDDDGRTGDAVEATPGRGWLTLREAGAALDDQDATVFTSALALTHWHARHPRCPRCGAPTRMEQGGWLRRCPDDGSEHHPRTDPAVIVAVTDPEDRILLGRGPHWPERRMSLLAGFVEAGESLEGAVVREVAEEVGVAVDGVTYRGNQPWPFPASLMVGFSARAHRTELTPDQEEVVEAAWFTRGELNWAVRSGEVQLPSRVSIARSLIEDWFGGQIEEGQEPAAPVRDGAR
jgi:NAD+ diphosphatase